METNVSDITSGQLNLIILQDEFYKQLSSSGKSLNTLKNYKTDLQCFNRFLLSKQKSLDLKDFNLTKVMEYGGYLHQKYDSNNSRRRRVQALRIFFDFLVKKSIYSENPVKKIPTSPKFLDRPRPTPFNDLLKVWQHLLEGELRAQGEIEKLLYKRNQIIFLLIYLSGLKVSDLAKLKLTHVTGGPMARVLVVPPKRDPYTIPLPGSFASFYEDYLQMLNALKSKSHIEFDEVLFNANPYRILSGGLTPRGLEIIFEEIRNKLNVVLTPKSLRQSCILNWLQRGINDALIKEWMGVAPNYSLKLYNQYKNEYIYSDTFIGQTH